MGIYRTHLIIDQRDSLKIKKLKLDNAKLILVKEPSNCFWEAKDGMSFGHYIGGRDPKLARKDEIPQLELLIEAVSEEKAEDLLSIIHGGMLLAYPEPGLTTNFVFLTEYNEKQNEWYSKKPFINYLKRIEHVGFGCQIASLAVKDKQLIYAIEKYKVSLELSSFTPKSADPMYGQAFDNYDIKHSYHTRSAFAIVSAFSVIEEFGLEVRSSSTNPRFLNNETGEWNPKVLKNITERLIQANIDSQLTFDWIYRGEPTKIELETKPLFGVDSKWIVYHKDVRDKTLTFPEAIHHASYLRNFIASHKFKELTQYISPYDVNNVQLLARQLIIRKMKMWKTMMTD
ncbi:hypothetical protein SAMN04488008_105146 [Maribacter orientalis]|uniref:Uncharacterized protein n=1 Tax=Maribacter orientalis TaxID=228957 RepID=A0A1H7SXK5_9FLAO|nr:hypothetical protein [Maribacter orientalis]SEL76766.1 hypothetical protein SAMN04488008_105146 [Maribacter orientalis]|tara:strand:+ start:1653 stop:2681 length:1029 start_codon:yes stop_codon:yes gene_type:complete